MRGRPDGEIADRARPRADLRNLPNVLPGGPEAATDVLPAMPGPGIRTATSSERERATSPTQTARSGRTGQSSRVACHRRSRRLALPSVSASRATLGHRKSCSHPRPCNSGGGRWSLDSREPASRAPGLQLEEAGSRGWRAAPRGFLVGKIPAHLVGEDDLVAHVRFYVRHGRWLALLRYGLEVIRGYRYLVCEDCGRRCEIWRAPDALWRELVTTDLKPSGSGRGVLCIACFDRKAWRAHHPLLWRIEN
jgi:hypothetical protein